MTPARRGTPPSPGWARGLLRPVAAALLLLLSTVAANAARPPGPSSPGRPATLQLSGDVTGLFPGGATSLPIEVANPHAFGIEVTSLIVTVDAATAACGSHYLVLGDLGAPVVVPARGQTTIMLDVMLVPDAPDSCQGASWPLSYSATATRS